MIIRRSTLNSPKFARVRKKRAWFSFWLHVVFIATVFFGLVYFSYHPSVTISSIEISGNDTTVTADIHTFVEQILAGKKLGLFPRNNTFLYPHDEIVESIFSKWASMQAVEVSLKNFTNLKVTVLERKIAYVWCGEALPVGGEAKHNCYYTDREGFIFGDAPQFTGDVYMRLYGAITAVSSSTPIRSSYRTPAEFAKVIAFVEEGEKMVGSKLSYLIASPNNQFDANFDRGVKILFSSDQDLNEAVINLRSFITQSKMATTSMVYKHFDIRYKDKVYFR